MEIKLDIKNENTLGFLKEFYEKHCLDTKDNVCTYKPIHLVQSEVYDYVPYSDELLSEWSDDYELCFIDTYDNDVSDNEVKFLEDFFEIDYAKPYEELEGKNLELKGGSFIIWDYDDYFEYYGLDKSDYQLACRKPRWETRAYFLIRNQAERYKEYQKHNLGKSRIYTDSSGYSNYGEWEDFYDLLISIGREIHNNGDK